MQIDNDKGYVDPLLSNLAVDYSARARADLVAPRLFPRIGVDKPSGYYPEMSKEDVYRVVDTRMSRNKGQANDVTLDGNLVPYATEAHGLKRTVSRAKDANADTPFNAAGRDVVQYLVGKLEQAQESRVVTLVTELRGSTTKLAGAGSAVANIWKDGGGKPLDMIEEKASALLLRPNICIMSRSVYTALKNHPDVIERLPNTSVQYASTEALAMLLDVPEVVVADGKGAIGKKTHAGDAAIKSLWTDVLVLARVDDSTSLQEPCCGKTVQVNYPQADGAGYVVSTWDENDYGVSGGTTYKVAHDVQELVIAKDLIHTITGILG